MLIHNEHIWTTTVSIHVDDADVSETEFAAAKTEVVEFLEYVDRVFSTFKPESIISRMRAGEIDESDIEVLALQHSEFRDVLEVIQLCRRVKFETRGAFDAWAQPGGFDPLGLVKGWAADRALEILKLRGFDRVMINAGGDIASNSSGSAWVIGIGDPDDRMSIIDVVHVQNQAVCTSGTSERGAHIQLNGRRQSTSARSATVIGPNAALADAYATAICVDGLAAIDWFKQLGAEWSCFVVPQGSQTGFKYGTAFAKPADLAS